MKIFKHRNIMGCIYGVLLAIPLLSVLATCMYVVVNKNAYQSYYGETINNYSLNKINNYTDIDSTTAVRISNSNINPTHNADLTSAQLYISRIIDASQNIPNNTDSVAFGIYTNSTSFHLYCYNNSTQIADIISNNTFYLDVYLETPIPTNNNALNLILNRTNALNFIEYNSYSYLDNVFEYSLEKVVHDNNFGNINFLQWFSDMFLDDNQVNNRYVGYANWYMNYVMFVSCAYLLFLVLMWFINFSRKLLERGMNYDW